MGKKRITKINGKILTQGGNPGDLRPDELDVNVSTDGKISITDNKGEAVTAGGGIEGIKLDFPIKMYPVAMEALMSSKFTNFTVVDWEVGMNKNPLIRFDGTKKVVICSKEDNQLTENGIDISGNPPFSNIYFLSKYTPMDWDSMDIIITDNSNKSTIIPYRTENSNTWYKTILNNSDYVITVYNNAVGESYTISDKTIGKRSIAINVQMKKTIQPGTYIAPIFVGTIEIKDKNGYSYKNNLMISVGDY